MLLRYKHDLFAIRSKWDKQMLAFEVTQKAKVGMLKPARGMKMKCAKTLKDLLHGSVYFSIRGMRCFVNLYDSNKFHPIC